MVLGKTTSIVDGQKAKEALGTNTFEMSGNLVSESWLRGFLFFLMNNKKALLELDPVKKL